MTRRALAYLNDATPPWAEAEPLDFYRFNRTDPLSNAVHDCKACL
jgi:hypothetical protein